MRALSKTGFAPEEASPPEFLSGLEYLQFVGEIRGLKASLAAAEAREMMDMFGLDQRKSIRNYSKGMRRQITLSAAFMGKPEFLVWTAEIFCFRFINFMH